MNDNFEFPSLIGGDKAPFIGYVTSRDKTVVTPQAMVRGSRNVYKKRNGNIAPRWGKKLRGENDADVDPVVASFEWYTSLGTVHPLRVLESGALQVESDVVEEGSPIWYTLQDDFELTDFVFDTWWDNTEKKDRVLMVNGDEDMKHWSGGIATAAAQAIGLDTLDKADTDETWAQAGFATNTAGEKKFKIYGSDTEYTYTGGENSTRLTGITPALPAISANAVIIQVVMTDADTCASGFNIDFIKTVNNQVYCGSYTSRLVYISSQSDFLDYTVPTPRTPGDPELLTLDAPGKGIGLKQGKAHIFCGTSFVHVVSFNQIPVGATLTEQTVAPRTDLANLQSALGHNFIDTVGDDLIYIAQDYQLRVFGTFRNINQPKYPSLSEQIETELTEKDFTGGALRGVGEFIYLTLPAEGEVYLHQTRQTVDIAGNVVSERFWNPPWELQVSRIAVINGVEFGHSSVNPQLYQIWNTGQYHDDAPDDQIVGYSATIRMAYRSHGRRQGLLSFNKVYYEGYILPNTELNSRVLYNYQGASRIEADTINSADDPATLFSSEGVFGVGGASIGELELGGGIGSDPDDFLPKFRTIIGLTLTNCFEYQLEVESNEPDSRWELICLGVNVKKSTEQAVFIKK